MKQTPQFKGVTWIAQMGVRIVDVLITNLALLFSYIQTYFLSKM